MGSVFCLIMSGILAEDLGWEYPFYVMGISGVVWFALWTLLIHDSPAANPRISDEERVYIEINSDFVQESPERAGFTQLQLLKIQ